MVQIPVDDIGDFNVPGIHILRKMRHRVEIIFNDSPCIASLFEAEAETEKQADERASEVLKTSVEGVDEAQRSE